MQIRLAETAGFCFGVERAVALAEQTARTCKNAVTLGPIIHNRHVVERFERLGLHEISSAEEAEPGQTVVIRAHGIPVSEQRMLSARGAAAVAPEYDRRDDIQYDHQNIEELPGVAVVKLNRDQRIVEQRKEPQQEPENRRFQQHDEPNSRHAGDDAQDGVKPVGETQIARGQKQQQKIKKQRHAEIFVAVRQFGEFKFLWWRQLRFDKYGLPVQKRRWRYVSFGLI